MKAIANTHSRHNSRNKMFKRNLCLLSGKIRRSHLGKDRLLQSCAMHYITSELLGVSDVSKFDDELTVAMPPPKASALYKPKSSRKRLVWARLTGISVCFLSSIRNW